MTEAHDVQSHEPFFRSTYEEGWERIQHHAKGVNKVLAKVMARHIEEENMVDLFSKVESIIFLLRDPRLVFRSSLTIRLSNQSEEEAAETWKVRSGFPELFVAYDIAVKHFPSKVHVLDFTSLCASPEATMRELCQRTGLEFSDNLIHEFPKTKDLISWNYNEKVKELMLGETPLGDRANTKEDPWMRNVRAARDFRFPKPWKTPVIPTVLEETMIEFVDQYANILNNEFTLPTYNTTGLAPEVLERLR